MPVLAGPALDRMSKELKAWWVFTKIRLVEELSQEYPYGAVKLDPMEQLTRFITMQPGDWEGILVRLQNLYRGSDNLHEQVSQELADMVSHMLVLEAERRGE